MSVGIDVSNLPKLRKSFDSVLKHIVRLFFRRTLANERSRSFNLLLFRSQATRVCTTQATTGPSVMRTENNESEKMILEEKARVV